MKPITISQFNRRMAAQDLTLKQLLDEYTSQDWFYLFEEYIAIEPGRDTIKVRPSANDPGINFGYYACQKVGARLTWEDEYNYLTQAYRTRERQLLDLGPTEVLTLKLVYPVQLRIWGNNPNDITYYWKNEDGSTSYDDPSS